MTPMEEPRLKLYFREVIYQNPAAKKTSVCGVFSYEAQNIEEARLGNIYIVGKISNLPPKKHKSFDFMLTVLASAIKRDFYADPRKNTLEALESALQGANIYLADFVKKGHDEWIGNIDFTCMVFAQNNIHIGQTGNMLVYLLRGQMMTNIARKFSIMQKSDPIKTFSNIASGTLEENDRLIISTDDIFALASAQKIKEINLGGDSEDFYDFIKENLKGQKQTSQKQEKSATEQINSLACLIVDVETKPPAKKKTKPKIVEPQNANLDLQKLANTYIRISINWFRPDFSQPGSSRLVNFLSRYAILNYFIALFLVAAIILSPYLVKKIDYESKITRIETMISRIQELIDKSAIALAYQDQLSAQNLLQQANDLTANIDSLSANLPQAAKDKIEKDFEPIKNRLELQENTINNVVVINIPEEITDLSQSTYSFEPKGMLVAPGMIYLFEMSSGFIDKIDLENSQTPTLSYLSSKDTFKLGAVIGDSIFLLADPEKMYIYEKNGNQSISLINPNLENTANIKDMDAFNNNIYFLDAQNQTIRKYAISDAVLSGSNWLKSGSDPNLFDAQYMAIDGAIYISKSDGTIFQYLQGQKQKEIKPKVSPPITAAAKLFTKDGMKNLYILDAQNKRIISVNKENNFTVQYVSENFSTLKDFWITEDENSVFLLDGLKIYKFGI